MGHRETFSTVDALCHIWIISYNCIKTFCLTEESLKLSWIVDNPDNNVRTNCRRIIKPVYVQDLMGEKSFEIQKS